MPDITAHLGLSTETISTVESILTRLLSNSVLLQVKLKQFHRNIRGEHFLQLHAFFDTLQGDLSPQIDDTAERIRSLGVSTIGTMKEFLDAASLREHPTEDISSTQMLTILLADYELIIRELREDITTTVGVGDDGNADFLTAIMEAHEKVAWMMRATLSEG